MKKVLYIGNFDFPDGNAAGKRVYANGKILKEIGYEVVFIGLAKNMDNYINLDDTEKEYDGFKNYNFSYPINNLSWINYNKTFISLVEFIDRRMDLKTIELIIYYGSPSLSLFINKLIKYAKKNRIKIISDCVDWLTVKTNNPFFDLIKWVDNTYQKAYLNKNVDGVIAISKYLKVYYEKAGKKTVIIPPLSPTEFGRIETNGQDYKVIIYAGIPFRKGREIKDINTLKDRIDKAIKLLYEAKEKGANFTFNIFGFTKDEYLISIPSQKKYVEGLSSSIVFHGMKSNSEVVEEIAKADFTMLIRDINRDTTAGFPTKVSESISYGTPVITTKTSDIEFYIQEYKNGFFLNENGESNVNKLVDILTISRSNIRTIKEFCIEQNPFLYSKYVTKLKEFIVDISK
jgi:glycosyltransferase involved in cell wall biosynthesis